MKKIYLLIILAVLVSACSTDSTTNPAPQGSQWELVASHPGDSLYTNTAIIRSLGILNTFGFDSVRLKVRYRGWLNPNGVPPGGMSVRKVVPPNTVTEQYLEIGYFQDSSYRYIDSVMVSHNINAEYEYTLSLYQGNPIWIQFKDLEIYKK